jgi:cell division protein FtsB
LSAYHPDDDSFQIAARQKMNRNFDGATVALILTWIGTACWAVCFWWMHRLSSRQEMMLKELHDVTKRIEKLSKAEHDLIREVHPKVDEIKESVKDVSDAVASQKS